MNTVVGMTNAVSEEMKLVEFNGKSYLVGADRIARPVTATKTIEPESEKNDGLASAMQGIAEKTFPGISIAFARTAQEVKTSIFGRTLNLSFVEDEEAYLVDATEIDALTTSPEFRIDKEQYLDANIDIVAMGVNDLSYEMKDLSVTFIQDDVVSFIKKLRALECDHKTLQDNVQTLKNTIGHRGITAIFTEKTEREKKLDKSSKLLSDLQTTIRTYRGMVNDYDAMIKSFEKKFVDTQWKGHRELGLNGKDDGGYSERKAAKEAKIARLKEQEEFDIKAKYRKELEPEIRAEMTRAERRGSSYSLSSGDAASEWFTEQTQGRKAEIAQRIVEKQRVIAETASGSYSL